MKVTFPILLILLARLASAGEVEIIVKPEKGTISPNEEIDVEVFILNDTNNPIEIPGAGMDKGYSITNVDFETVFYDVEDEKLENRGTGSESRMVTHLGYVKLKPRDSRRYKFRWKAPDGDFDMVILSPTFFINGEFRAGRTTLTTRPQQGAAEQPATRSESK